MICANNHSVRELLESEFWAPERRNDFSNQLVIDFVNAPPGMKQHMDAFESVCCFEWLNRTVKTWNVDVKDFYGSADGKYYWSTGVWGGDVCWGRNPGHFEATYILRIEIFEGLVTCMKVWTNPLAMLRAANREIPLFRIDTEAPEVKAFMEEAANAPAPEPVELDAGEAAVQARIQDTLNYFLGEDAEMVVSDDCTHAVFFLPPEMKERYTAGELPAVEAWSCLSNMSENCFFKFLPSGKVYPTEDPLVFFGEFNAVGRMNWIGNEVSGHYHNTYAYIVCFDEMGRVTRFEEYMDTMNKFNSIDISIPSFPYYF